MHGLPPIPASVPELRSALIWAEARFWEANAAMAREWEAIKNRWQGDDTPGRERYEATKKPVSDALAAALLTRMLLNAATGERTPSDVWECRACTDDEEDDCVEVTVPREVMQELEEAARMVRCSPQRALCNTMEALPRR